MTTTYPNGVRFACGCETYNSGETIQRCALHHEAPAMLEVLRQVAAEHEASGGSVTFLTYDEVRTVLARIDGATAEGGDDDPNA